MKKKIVITAGGTSEKIDNVRKITNSSTGKLGKMIAEKMMEYKEKEIEVIYYICSKEAVRPDNKKVKIIEITDTEDLKKEVTTLLHKEKIDYFIHSMAVSDYTVDYVTTSEKLAESIVNSKENVIDVINKNQNTLNDNKISSNLDNLIIKLKKTPKIINLIKKESPETYLVGFKLLDNVSEEELREVAYKLMVKNKCNLVVANDLNNIRKGNHKAFIVKNEDKYIEANGKEDIAVKLIEEMMNNG